MTYGTPTSKSQRLGALTALGASLAMLSVVSAPAHADRRQPAPIVFAGQGNTPAPVSRAQRQQPSSSVSTSSALPRAAAPAPSERRVEFRYPDQPDTFYGAGGARKSTSAAPLVFSSAKTAISEAEAQQYALPAASAPAQPRDPFITPGGFDARAAAAAVEQRQENRVSPQRDAMVIEPLAPIPDQMAPTPATAPRGAVFQPVANTVYDERGKASVFDPALNGQPTANGEILDAEAMIAAHPTLPLPSLVQVINLENDKEIVVRVNDRGPLDNDGLIEMSERAARLLGLQSGGNNTVRVRYLGPAPQLSTSAAQPVNRAPEPVLVPQPEPVFARPAPTKLAIASIERAPEPQLLPQPGTSNPFFVQMASFADIANAQRMHQTLRSKVTNVEIVAVTVRGTDFFRVVAGPVDGRVAAERLRDQLASQGMGRGLVKSAS